MVINITEINEKHDKAMEYAALGLLARQRGEENALALFQKAFELEVEVTKFLEYTDLEPSRSVLFRSAATLALDCGEIREAEKLAAKGLAGNPPGIIAQELREVLQQALDAMAKKAAGD